MTLVKAMDSGSLDTGLLDEYATGESSRRVVVNRTHRPSRLSVIVKAPDGTPIARWAQDEPKPENVFSGLTFGGEMPGGHKELSLRLPRDPKRSYPDLALFNRIEVQAEGGEVLWSGTIRQEPTTDGAQMGIEVKAAGDMQFLEDDPTVVGPGFINCDLSRWTGPSTSRRISLLNSSSPNQQDPTATPDAQGDTALHLEVQGTWQSPVTPRCEGWFDSGGGIQASAIYGDWVNGDTNTLFILAVFFADDDAAVSFEQSGDGYTATTGHFAWAPATSKRYVGVYWGYNSTPAGADGYQFAVDLVNLKVIGTNGLALQGVWPNQGYLAKQMIPFIADLAGLTTEDELLEDDGFVIPHAWFDSPGTLGSKLVEVTKYGLLDWFVFNDRILQYRFPDTYGRTWRLGPGNGPKNSGADAGQVYDRFKVQWQDVDGTTKSIGITGSGADYIDDRLLVTDDRNPAVAADHPRGKLISLNGVCTAGLALEVGLRVKEELENLRQSGEVTLTDHVQDEASGAWYPVSYVQPGDRVREQATGLERKITSTGYADESLSNNLTIGAPPEGEKAIEERFNARLLELGFGG